ncbi:unnamed protein product [Didymodactylos carnosus]|uniref:Uncharacterized protein n=1 Tax=Didymodactylos carnosus TaxID=1234261 RepID=A0A814WD89_9BILA|nr:unnamed protein product [Didymodactylos carnosus]CAF3961381.1 unnamed protein product [Didymodactylos carnosus]
MYLNSLHKTLKYSIFSDVLSQIKSLGPNIRQTFVRTDYHSAQTILSWLEISKETNINVKRMDFYDPQGSKGLCDQYSAIIKRHSRRYLNEGHDHNVTTAAEFDKAYETKSSYQFPKVVAVNFVNNLLFDSTGVRFHRSWLIGRGKTISWNGLNCQKKIPKIKFVNVSSSSSQQWGQIQYRETEVSKLEKVDEREMISISLQLLRQQQCSSLPHIILPQGWALSKRRKKNIRWTPETAAGEVEPATDEHGHLLFGADEFLKLQQIR